MVKSKARKEKDSMTDVVTKVFCDGDEIPLRIKVPVRIPIADVETADFTLKGCYTSGKSEGYRLCQVRYGVHCVVFCDYMRARQ